MGPEGTLPERWLPVTSMPLAPRSAMPIPEKFTVELRGSTRARIVLDRVAFHLEATYGFVDPKASKNMPAQLSWIVFPAKEPP